MNKNFTHKDILDLEYFHYLDEGEPYDRLHKRDRQICLTQEGEKSTTATLLLDWLTSRRNTISRNNQASPGTIMHEALNLFAIILPLLGLTVGLFSGLAFFTYTGETPVNVFHFLFLFVFSQLLTLLLFTPLLLIQLVQKAKKTFPVTLRFYTYLVTVISTRIQRSLSATTSAKMSNTYRRQLLSLMRKTLSKYGSLMLWPFFTLSQKILVAVNLGLLTATLFQVATSDLAFGWQSTISLSPEALFSFVQTIALPWSWFVPESLAYPSIEAIEGSKIILKEGIYNLATRDLVAWWPFLIYCLVFYGLVVRSCLLVIGFVLQIRSLKNLKLNTPATLQLIQRMTTPVVSTQATKKTGNDPTMQLLYSAGTLPVQDTNHTNISAILLIPEDIAQETDDYTISSFISGYGFIINDRKTIMHDYEKDRRLLQNFSVDTKIKDSTVIVVSESWMVPTGDLLSFLKNLRSVLNTTTPIYIGLLEKFPGDTARRQNTQQYQKVWKQKIDSLADPYLSLLPLPTGTPVSGAENDS